MSVPSKFLSWKEAVENECVVAYVAFDELDPEKTLHNLILWHVQVALDPLVSLPAQKLIEHGRNSFVPIGEAERGAMTEGFTMAVFKESAVPLGTKLFRKS